VARGLEAASGGVALATAAPKTRFHARASEVEMYARKAHSVVIRHRSGHEIVAVLEVMSPGNKASKAAIGAFVEKVHDLTRGGIHLLVIDLFPPTGRDPDGIHRLLWGEGREGDFALPSDQPLTCVSYCSASFPEAFLEPVAVGDRLPEMPLYVLPSAYVEVPLESTYLRAWEAVPRVWREVIAEGASA
jgi:hypothetical protein